MNDKISGSCVMGCRRVKGEAVSYHEYPSDPVCRAKWIKALKIDIDEKGEEITTFSASLNFILYVFVIMYIKHIMYIHIFV
jgi:hypothetical protein